MRHTLYIAMVCSLGLAACNSKSGQTVPEAAESRQAKALLQGIWEDEETEEVSFRAEGDTIYYPDSTSQPAYFRVLADSLVLGDGSARYAIVKQTEHLFWFKNQSGDLVKLRKTLDQEDASAFTHDEAPKVLTYTEVVKLDSVVMYGGERYHWYIAINPTKYRVTAKTYNDDGMEVENVYYDNIIHVSVFHGAQKVFSRDFNKQMYAGKIPARFLSQAILSNMEYAQADAQGLHFDATLCNPDGVSCYKVENVISHRGELTTKLLEY